MSSQHFDAERLRRDLHDLSSDVARRLIAVLDAARDGAHELSHEFNAVVCEITAIQRELVQELTGPQPAKTDVIALARMVELNKRAMTLLEHLEALPAEPAFDYPGLRGRPAAATSSPEHSALAGGQRHAQASGGPRARVSPAYDDPNSYVPYDVWVRSGAVLPQPRGPRANVALMARNVAAGRRLGSFPASGVIAAAVVVAFGLSATVGAHIFSGESVEVESVVQAGGPRGDKLAVTAKQSDTKAGATTRGAEVNSGTTSPSSESRRVEQAALVSETGALPSMTEPEQASLDEGADTAFVAVLATQDNEDGARDALERLRESYPAILGPITAQVETVEGEGGRRWFRLTARPPVSREEANDLCRRLSEAGHTGCWVKPQRRTRDGSFVAVLATRDDPAVAIEDFRRLKTRYPAILGTFEAQIDAVETQGGTTWHRLSTLPAVSQAEAKDLCKRLRKAGYAMCWVKPRG